MVATALYREKVTTPENDNAVAEGVLIARSALTMAVKNHIIIEAIAQDHGFDRADAARFTKGELRLLSEEQRHYAELARESVTAAARAQGPPQHRHDYRPADQPALEQREAIYESLARELLRLSDDENYIGATAEVARIEAWDEIAAAILGRLERIEAIRRDPLYEKGKKKRLRELRRIDLAALRKAAR